MALGGMSTNTLSAMVTNLEPRAARFALALYDSFIRSFLGKISFALQRDI
jgi:hypothetical protein